MNRIINERHFNRPSANGKVQNEQKRLWPRTEQRGKGFMINIVLRFSHLNMKFRERFVG